MAMRLPQTFPGHRRGHGDTHEDDDDSEDRYKGGVGEKRALQRSSVSRLSRQAGM